MKNRINLSGSQHYTALAKFFHWLTAALIFVMLPLGFYMVWLENSPFKFDLYQWHKSIGMTILLIAVLRFGWTLSSSKPPYDPGLSLWEIWLSRLVHVFLYVALFAMPLTGWLMTSASDFPNRYFGLFQIPDLVGKNQWLYDLMSESHEIIAFIVLALVALHVTGAIKHYLLDKDQTLQKMLPVKGPKGQKFYAFSYVFVMIVSFSLTAFLIYQVEFHQQEKEVKNFIEGQTKAEPASEFSKQEARDQAGKWIILSKESRIGFNVDVYGEPFSGRFHDYEGDIFFDPQGLKNAHAFVRVKIKSVESGNKERDGYIVQEPWLYAEKYPFASFTSKKFDESPEGSEHNFTVTGDLSLRGVSREISMPFTFESFEAQSGEEKAKAYGRFTIDREEFGIGQGPWAQGNTVGEKVRITIKLVAKKPANSE